MSEYHWLSCCEGVAGKKIGDFFARHPFTTRQPVILTHNRRISMKKRIFLIIGLILMVLLVVATGSFFSSKLAWLSGNASNGPVTSSTVDVPTDTPIVLPTATPTSLV